MTDIVERLRFRDAGEDADRLIEIMHKAADEIERLEHMQANLHGHIKRLVHMQANLHGHIKRLEDEKSELFKKIKHLQAEIDAVKYLNADYRTENAKLREALEEAYGRMRGNDGET